MSSQENKETNCTAIKLYQKSEAYIFTGYATQEHPQTIVIMEFVELQYHQMLSFATKDALLSNQYDSQGRPLLFLSWRDNYLFFHGPIKTLSEYNGEEYPDYLLSFFYYTRFGPYKEVILDTIFEEKIKICVDKTTRPILTQIIDYIKTLEPKTHD